MDEYRVKVGIRNNLILDAIEQLGFKSVAAFCRQYGVSQTQVADLVNFRLPPITKGGEFCLAARNLMEALGAAPSDLWTDHQLTMCLTKNSSERSVSEQSVMYLLEDNAERMLLPDPQEVLERIESDQLMRDMLQTLTPKEEKVLKMRHGVGGQDMTLEECGKSWDLTPERIRQIENKAERKLKHPRRRVVLMEGLGMDLDKYDQQYSKTFNGATYLSDVRATLKGIADERKK